MEYTDIMSSMSDYLKSPDLLKEHNRDFDFFDYSSYAKNLHHSINASESPSVTTLIGGYGTGKSVLLNEVRKITAKKKGKNKPKWVVFECWQYPDKRDLWEALIVQLVHEIDGKDLNKTASEYSDIEGWRDDAARFLSSTKNALTTLLAITVVYGLILDAVQGTAWESLLMSFAVASILLLLGTLEFIAKPTSKSSISRLSDYKAELNDILKENKSDIYIVLEDVDRGGELGRRFFEAVAHFMREGSFSSSKINIIVPMADIEGDDKKALRDSVQKASDNILYFKPTFEVTDFVEQLFTEDFLNEGTKELLVSTINPLLGRQINVRDHKHILSNAIGKHERLLVGQ